MRPEAASIIGSWFGDAHRLPACAVAVLVFLTVSPQVSAADVDGGITLFKTATDNQGLGVDSQEVLANFSLYQRFTPYVGARFAYLYSKFDTENDLGGSAFLRNRTPRLELSYSRSRSSLLLAAEQSVTDGTGTDFEQRSLLANFQLRPVNKPGLRLSFRDQRNVVDPAIFGRDNRSRFYTVEAFYERRWGRVRYQFNRNELENSSTGFGSEQNRQELRLTGGGRAIDGRLRFGGEAVASRFSRETLVLDPTTPIAEPIRAVQGLFAVDTTPQVGELDSSAGLIDGDFDTPAAPGIDIGGGNTFRNVGLDLGLKIQVTRLEVSVNTVSAANLVWEVYRSPDNLVWEPIANVVSQFDAALLRYTLTFPEETTEQFFKAVNVSANTEPQVFVTEVRAFIDVFGDPGTLRTSGNLYRADLNVGFQASPGLSTRLDLGFSTDEDIAAGFVRRDFREIHAGLGLAADLARHLRFNVGYRYNDIRNLSEPVLLREESLLNAALEWTPLPTVDAVLTYGWRDESSEGVRLQTSQTARLLLGTVFMPDLRLTTDLSATRLDDPFSDFTRNGWAWRETLSMVPAPRWTLAAIVFLSENESADGTSSLRRESYGLSTNWFPTAYLALNAGWFIGRENEARTTRQNYSLSYNPGPKLSLSATYSEYDTEGFVFTASSGARLTYRLNRHFSFFGTLARTRTGNFGIETGEVNSLRLGLRFNI